MENRDVRCYADNTSVILCRTNSSSDVSPMPYGRRKVRFVVLIRVACPISLISWIRVSSIAIAGRVGAIWIPANHVNAPALWCVGEQIRMVGASRINDRDDNTRASRGAPRWRNIRGALFAGCRCVHIPL